MPLQGSCTSLFDTVQGLPCSLCFLCQLCAGVCVCVVHCCLAALSSTLVRWLACTDLTLWLHTMYGTQLTDEHTFRYMTLPLDGPCSLVATNRLAQPSFVAVCTAQGLCTYLTGPLHSALPSGCPEPVWQGAGQGPKPNCMLHGQGGG